MRDFNDVKTLAPLFREMADDIDQCLAEGDQSKLVGCLTAICCVFQFHLMPAIFARKEALQKEKERAEEK